MNVLKNNVPKLDYSDPSGSLQKIYNYLYEVMEQIDYTLSRQGIQLGKVNVPATAKQIEQLEGKVNGLSSSLAVISGTVSVVNSKADTLTDRMTGLDNTAGQIQAELSALDDRVTALEEKQGG